MRFRALRTFNSGIVKSTYMEGLQYTVRPGNEVLAELAGYWLELGWVEVIEEGAVAEARISGQGVVAWR